MIQYSDMAEAKFNTLREAMEKAPAGVFVDVGTRKGGSALLALSQPQSSLVISVDPWGGKPYDMQGNSISTEYDDDMARDTMALLSAEAQKLHKTHLHYRTTSLDFFNLDHTLWLDGEESRLKNIKFSFVLLDGEHTSEAVSKELVALKYRMVDGGVVMIDNTDWIDLKWDSKWESPRFDMKYKIY